MKRVSLRITLVISTLLFFCNIAFGGTIYVKPGGTGAGTNWGDAFGNLQYGLDAAGVGDAIWVAAGTYYPTTEVGGAGARFQTFQMKNGVGIYGGFNGTEIAFTLRDVENNVTILSGDIGVALDDTDNCYHVFYHPTGSNLAPNAILDGFTVSDGNADGSGDHNDGGGMCNYNSSPTVKNCTFTNNYAFDSGGGMCNHDSSGPIVYNCIFTNNSASNSGGGIINWTSSSATITSCTFTNNFVPNYGGGIMNWNSASSTIVTDCVFTDNSVNLSGGGICNYNSSPTVTDCTFTNNSTFSLGGGMSNENSSNPIITGCTFITNSADFFGGGMANEGSSSPMVTNCTFVGNTSDSDGGGMMNWSNCSPTVTDCVFTDNSALYGGGMNNWADCDPNVTNCIFINNVATYGGGMHNGSSSPTVINCTFSGNSTTNYGGGMANTGADCASAVTNCTFTGNSAATGGGMCNENSSSATALNCILWGNSATNGNEIALLTSSTIDVDHSDVQGGVGGIYDDASGNTINWNVSNIDTDPMFVDADGDDNVPGTEDDNLRLGYNSPCIDAGDNSAVTQTADLDGLTRIVNGDCDTIAATVDMGAYELNWLYFGDFDFDCDIDYLDFGVMSPSWLSTNFAIDIVPVGAPDGIIDLNELLAMANHWLEGATP